MHHTDHRQHMVTEFLREHLNVLKQNEKKWSNYTNIKKTNKLKPDVSKSE